MFFSFSLSRGIFAKSTCSSILPNFGAMPLDRNYVSVDAFQFPRFLGRQSFKHLLVNSRNNLCKFSYFSLFLLYYLCFAALQIIIKFHSFLQEFFSVFLQVLLQSLQIFFLVLQCWRVKLCVWFFAAEEDPQNYVPGVLPAYTADR